MFAPQTRWHQKPWQGFSISYYAHLSLEYKPGVWRQLLKMTSSDNLIQVVFRYCTQFLPVRCYFGHFERCVDVFVEEQNKIRAKPSAVCTWVIERFSFECQKVIGFAITAPHNWLKKRAPIFHPIRSQTKTNRNSLARVFPRFASATCNHFDFWLVHCIVCVFCDWLEWLVWFWFHDTQLKTALFASYDWLFLDSPARSVDVFIEEQNKNSCKAFWALYVGNVRFVWLAISRSSWDFWSRRWSQNHLREIILRRLKKQT